MNAIQLDHHLQSKIFAKLRYNQTMRYSDLKDPAIESSLFVYHLKELIKRKLVEKTDNGEYRLTSKGAGLAQLFSSEMGKMRLGPLTYSLIFLRSNKNRWLVVKRKKHPHINKYACISGKVWPEETVESAAKRELHYFTGGNITAPLEYRGYASVMIQTKELRTHITGPIWFADNLEEIELPDLKHATPQWVEWQKLPYDEFIPGWKEIVAMIESSQKEYLDLSFSD